jgi:hypothetical protein
MLKCCKHFMPTDQLDSHREHLESIEVDYPYAAENVLVACKTASTLTTLACEILVPADSVQTTPAQQTQSFSSDVAGCKQYPQAYQRRISEVAKCPRQQEVEEFCRGIMSASPLCKVTRQQMSDAWKAAHPQEDCDSIFKKLKIDDLYEMPREKHIQYFWEFAVNHLKTFPRATKHEVQDAYLSIGDGCHSGKRAGSTHSMFKDGWINMKDLKNAAGVLTAPTSACEGVDKAQAEAVDTGAAQLRSSMVSLVENPGKRKCSLDLDAVRAQKRARRGMSDTASDLQRFVAFGIEKLQENHRISIPELSDSYLQHLESRGIEHNGKVMHFLNHAITMKDLAHFAGVKYVKQRTPKNKSARAATAASPTGMATAAAPAGAAAAPVAAPATAAAAEGGGRAGSRVDGEVLESIDDLDANKGMARTSMAAEAAPAAAAAAPVAAPAMAAAAAEGGGPGGSSDDVEGLESGDDHDANGGMDSTGMATDDSEAAPAAAAAAPVAAPPPPQQLRPPPPPPPPPSPPQQQQQQQQSGVGGLPARYTNHHHPPPRHWRLWKRHRWRKRIPRREGRKPRQRCLWTRHRRRGGSVGGRGGGGARLLRRRRWSRREAAVVAAIAHTATAASKTATKLSALTMLSAKGDTSAVLFREWPRE